MICSNDKCSKEFDYVYGKIYCSRSCAAIVNNSKRPKRNLGQWPCKGCQKILERESWQDRRVFCDDCRLNRRQELVNIARSSRKPASKKEPILYEFICKKCNLSFTSTTKTRSYCSAECRKYSPIKRESIDWESLTIQEVRGEGNANQRSRLSYVRGLARKKYLKSNKPKACLICNYDYHFDVCHVKDVYQYSDDALIREVNHIDNLVALCKNHHWEFDTGKLSIKINDIVIQK